MKRQNHADIKRPTALRALSAAEANEKWWPYSPDLPSRAIFHFVTIRKPRWHWSLSRSTDLWTDNYTPNPLSATLSSPSVPVVFLSFFLLFHVSYRQVRKVVPRGTTSLDTSYYASRKRFSLVEKALTPFGSRDDVHGRINLGQPHGLRLCIDGNHRRFSLPSNSRGVSRLAERLWAFGRRSVNCFDKRNLRGGCVECVHPPETSVDSWPLNAI